MGKETKTKIKAEPKKGGTKEACKSRADPGMGRKQVIRISYIHNC